MSPDKTVLSYFLPHLHILDFHSSKHTHNVFIKNYSRIFEIPHTNYRISFGQIYGIFVFVNKTTTNKLRDLDLHTIQSYLTLSVFKATLKTFKRSKY